MVSYPSPVNGTPLPPKKVTFNQLQQGSTYRENNHWSQGLLPESIREIINEKYDLRHQLLYSVTFIIIQLLVQLSLSSFYLICLLLAYPGSTYHRTIGFPFMFVYSGTLYMRHLLIASYFILIVTSIAFIIISIAYLIQFLSLNQLRNTKVYDKLIKLAKFWLFSLVTFLIIKVITFIFQYTVNDLFYAYHFLTLILWLFFIVIDGLIILIIYPNLHSEINQLDQLDDQSRHTFDSIEKIESANTDDSLASQSIKSPRSSLSINQQSPPDSSSYSTSIFEYKMEKIERTNPKTFQKPFELKVSSPTGYNSSQRTLTQTPV